MGLICLLMRIIISVGYIPYIKSVFRKRRRNTCVVLTETIVKKIKPSVGNGLKSEIV